MKNKKRKILYVAVVAICLSILTGSTLAYFTTTDTAHNVITSGDIDIEVVQQELQGGVLQPIASAQLRMMPSTSVSRVVSVTNKAERAWVRMSYSLTVYDGEEQPLPLSQEELRKVVLISPDAEQWTLQDGWWYYNHDLKTGESTTPLFESVTFSGVHMDDVYQGCTVELTVTAQAVQYAHNGIRGQEITGWPE